ncbi:MAG: PAS domain S-box protein [Trueperaceae bacterium]|nr:PAS domain S-box protein [Trueperaceae bacterium]
MSGAGTSNDTFGCQLVLHDGSTVWTYVRLARVHDTADEAADEADDEAAGQTPAGRAHLTFSYPLLASRLTPVRSPADDRFRAFFENSFDAAFLTAPDGRILEANPAASAMFGYTLEELRAKGRSAVVDTSDPRLATMLREREATGATRGHLSMRRKDGSRFEADLASSVYTAPAARRAPASWCET